MMESNGLTYIEAGGYKEVNDPDISIIVVNYNGGKQVEICIGSIYENPASSSFEVILVDNGSSDGSPERIEQNFPQVRLKRRADNIGLAKAFNEGVALMRGRYLLSLDDGTKVLPGAIDALYHFLEQSPQVGAAGSRLYDLDKTIQPVARRFPTPLNAIFGRRSLITRLFPNNPFSARYLMPEFADSTDPFEVDWNSSAALMVRRAVIDQIGAMSPEYFVYWVDADWCLRMHNAGWKVYCVPASKVMHLENLRTGHRPTARSKMVIDFHKGAYRFYTALHQLKWWHPIAVLTAIALISRTAILLTSNILRLGYLKLINPR